MRNNLAHVNHPRFKAGPWRRLPAFYHPEVAAYIVTGAAMRPFLRAVAAGDLFAATHSASVVDIRTVAEFFEAMPERSRGNWTRVCEWELIGGLHGIDHLNEAIGRAYP